MIAPCIDRKARTWAQLLAPECELERVPVHPDVLSDIPWQKGLLCPVPVFSTRNLSGQVPREETVHLTACGWVIAGTVYADANDCVARVTLRSVTTAAIYAVVALLLSLHLHPVDLIRLLLVPLVEIVLDWRSVRASWCLWFCR